jgi:hypothetical protein
MHSEVLSNSLREARGSFKNWLLGEANDRTAAHNSDRVSTDVDQLYFGWLAVLMVW